MMETAAHWLVTYLIHSTLLLAGALLLRFALGEKHLALQEAALKAALLGGFLTATLQLGLGVRSLGLIVPLPRSGPSAAETARREEARESSAGIRPEAAVGGVVASDRRPSLPAAVAPAPLPTLAAAWLVLGLIAGARLMVAAARLRELLRDRRPIGDGALAAGVRRLSKGLGLRRPVRLSLAPRLTVPLATGLRRPEVCLPARALVELTGDERLALLAHELAHVARRDPAWILLARLAEAAAPLQPLNLWARRRLQDLAECLSDDLAAGASERPESLARSLVDVASWTLVEPAFLPGMAAGAVSPRSRLGHRVERLMNPIRVVERPRRLLLPMALAVVASAAFVIPAVSDSPESGGAPARPEEPAATPTPPEPPLPPEAGAAPDLPDLPDVPPPPRPPRAPRSAAPIPPAPPTAPRPAVAPEPPRSADSDTEHALEELSARISARVGEHEAELEAIESRLEALVAAGAHPSQSEMRELQEKARALAQASRPTSEELAQLRRLSEEVARNALASADEARRSAREGAALTREEMRRAVDEMRRAVEETRRVGEEVRRALREMQRAREEAQREAPPRP